MLYHGKDEMIKLCGLLDLNWPHCSADFERIVGIPDGGPVAAIDFGGLRPRSKSVTADEPLPCRRIPRAKEDFA
jgi:hypothetical protein